MEAGALTRSQPTTAHKRRVGGWTLTCMVSTCKMAYCLWCCPWPWGHLVGWDRCLPGGGLRLFGMDCTAGVLIQDRTSSTQGDAKAQADYFRNITEVAAPLVAVPVPSHSRGLMRDELLSSSGEMTILNISASSACAVRGLADEQRWRGDTSMRLPVACPHRKVAPQA